MKDKPTIATTNRDRLFAMIDEVHKRNLGVPLEDIEADVRLAIAEVRGQPPGTFPPDP